MEMYMDIKRLQDRVMRLEAENTMEGKCAHTPSDDDEKSNDAIWLYRRIKRHAPQASMLNHRRIQVPANEGETPWTYIIDVDTTEAAKRLQEPIDELHMGVKNCAMWVKEQTSWPGDKLHDMSREFVLHLILKMKTHTVFPDCRQVPQK